MASYFFFGRRSELFPFYFLKLDVFVHFSLGRGWGRELGKNLGFDFQFFGELAGRMN